MSMRFRSKVARDHNIKIKDEVYGIDEMGRRIIKTPAVIVQFESWECTVEDPVVVKYLTSSKFFQNGDIVDADKEDVVKLRKNIVSDLTAKIIASSNEDFDKIVSAVKNILEGKVEKKEKGKGKK